MRPHGKESTEVRITQKMENLPKNEEISGGKAHTKFWRSHIFLYLKRVNEHMVKMSFRKVPPQGVARQEWGRGGDGGKIKWKLSEVNIRAVS